METAAELFPLNLLPASQLEAVLKLGNWVTYAAGDLVLEEGGAPASHFYFLEEGQVRLSRGGQPQAVLGPGSFLALPSLLSGEPPRYSLVVQTPVRLLRLPREALPLLLSQPRLAELLLEGLVERIHLPEREEALLFQPARSLIRRPPVCISPQASVAQAAQKMALERVSSLLVEGDPPGILTDRDLRNRVLAQGLGPETPVAAVMSAPVRSLPGETPLFETLAYMVEQGIHHLPLTEEGHFLGVLTHTAYLEAQTQSPLFLLKRIERLELSQYGQALGRLVENLLNGGVPALRIGEIVATLNDALIRRLLRQAEARLGPPPVPYAFVVYGSEGRKEQALLTDQDNALVLGQETGTDYFRALAEAVVEGLHQAGFPYCQGGFMATRYRQSLAAWQEMLLQYMENPEPQALLEAQIFFDFRPVHGQLELTPLEELILERARRGVFLYHLAKASLAFRPPLGLFGRLQAPSGELDLKRAGIAPIVSLARLYGLLAQSRARATLARLNAAAQAGHLSLATSETLAEGYAFLFELRLRQQLMALRQGQPPSNRVRLAELSPKETRRLKEVFQAILQAQEATLQRFQIR